MRDPIRAVEGEISQMRLSLRLPFSASVFSTYYLPTLPP